MIKLRDILQARRERRRKEELNSIGIALNQLKGTGEFTRAIKKGVWDGQIEQVIKEVKDQIDHWPGDMREFLGEDLFSRIKEIKL